MSDVRMAVRGADWAVEKLLQDQGDGTHAEVVALAAGGGTPGGQAGATGHVHEPGADTAAVVTLAAAGAALSNVLGLVAWSYDDDPTGGSLTIEDGVGSTVFKVDIIKGGPGFFPFDPGLQGSVNTALVATLAAGGAGVSGIVSVHAWTE